MRTPIIILKASLLATCIFWVFLFGERHFEPELSYLIVLIPLSVIPISIICAITIVLTISPFFELKKNKTTNKQVFEKWFPFYAIICFTTNLLGSITLPEIICFFASAFFTCMQSWVWFGLKKDNPIT